MSDITPDERRILSRSIEYRNSVSLADAMSRIKTEHSEEINKLKEQNISFQRRLVELEARVQAFAALALSSRGPTSRG
jgi:hypothetical protein